MKIIDSYYVIEEEINPQKIMATIEKAGRTCYKSENNISDGSAEKFIGNILRSGHESVIEHEKITVRFICDRGVTHELVRHRIASYSQESTRYCNYTNDKFGNELTFIKPSMFSTYDMDIPEHQDQYLVWRKAMEDAETYYLSMINAGATPDLARSILPNSLKTEIVVTMNLREWRHFFKLRCSNAAHPDIRKLARALHKEFSEKLPIIFGDIKY